MGKCGFQAIAAAVEVGFDGTFRAIQQRGDLGNGQAIAVMQAEHGTWQGRQLVNGRMQCGDLFIFIMRLLHIFAGTDTLEGGLRLEVVWNIQPQFALLRHTQRHGKRHAADPGAQGAFAAELAEAAVHPQKHFLTAVLGFLPVLQHAPGHMPDQFLMVFDDFRERPGIAAQRTLGERMITPPRAIYFFHAVLDTKPRASVAVGFTIRAKLANNSRISAPRHVSKGPAMIVNDRPLRQALLAGFILTLTACTGVQTKPVAMPAQASTDLTVRHYDYRTWYPPQAIPFDPIEVGKSLQSPINTARAKAIGPEYEDSVQSLAAKLWLIENAKYTVDMAYYIFKRDRVGYAMIGALCNAVKRGVDVRLTIDSGGSIHPSHSELKALQTCSEDGGFLRDAAGNPTDRKARAQVVIVNALSKVFVKMNRRSHDKLIVVDGLVPEHAFVMTGGRNISVDYYGITEDGAHDPSAYQDMELMIRPAEAGSGISVGEAATFYYTLLFLNEGNKYLRASGTGSSGRNQRERDKAQEDLAYLKNVPAIQAAYARMNEFAVTGFEDAKVKLAHELGNLTNKNVVTKNLENMGTNSNSIRDIFRDMLTNAQPKSFRIVSPYFFFAKYQGRNGKEGFDGAASVLKILEDNPDRRFEMITNSALTSDNFMAQSVIDMDTAPRLLLTPEMAERWRAGLRRGQVDRALVESPEWKRMVDNPRIRIYETGRGDAVEFGGTVTYGKLHAKFMVFDDAGFVGTDNFDYRSRLFNNEFGFFYQSAPLSAELNAEFDKLRAKSYLWGSPEWLDARDKLMAQKGMKAATTRYQRFLYKFARSTGLIWLF